eukprot:m.130354 g.130354  ORF g.130354 m.130354 type:complete len:378 (-) comp14602_c0_seq1:4874-6007(-)
MGGSSSKLPPNPNFLEKPLTEQTVEAGSTSELAWACSCMQGWRAHMEDEHIISVEIEGLPGCALYAVMDGHAGTMAAKFSKANLQRLIVEELKGENLDATADEEAPVKIICSKLERSVMRLDEELRNFNLDCGGTTCTFVFVTPACFFFVNLGDSRCLLNRGGKAFFHTRDHKPFHSRERARIKAAGGYVISGRVDGGLAVSRALGDFGYKNIPERPATDQKVSSQPTVDVVPRVPGKDQFLLIACDGVWDVMSCDSASKFIYSRVKRQEARNVDGVRQACVSLVERSLQLGSRDNISVAVILFEKSETQKVTKKEGKAKASLSKPKASHGGPMSRDDLIQVAAETIAFMALERGISIALNGPSERLTRRDTILRDV